MLGCLKPSQLFQVSQPAVTSRTTLLEHRALLWISSGWLACCPWACRLGTSELPMAEESTMRLNKLVAYATAWLTCNNVNYVSIGKFYLLMSRKTELQHAKTVIWKSEPSETHREVTGGPPALSHGDNATWLRRLPTEGAASNWNLFWCLIRANCQRPLHFNATAPKSKMRGRHFSWAVLHDSCCDHIQSYVVQIRM